MTSSGPSPKATRQIDFRQSAQLVPILEHLGCSLLVSTYAAGKVISVGTSAGELHLGFTNFQQAMGIAAPSETATQNTSEAKTAAKDSIAVGGTNAIWLLRDGGSLAQRIDPDGGLDRLYLARESFLTGNIAVHEMAWGDGGQLWMVNTLFSCLATLHEDYNFVPQWHPPFITSLVAEDRCHLNGMAMVDGRPRYVTALGTSDEERGWRPNKSEGGVLIDVPSGEIIASGFCMPHSPRQYLGNLFVLDSGRGRLVRVDAKNGDLTEVADYPGYGRGLAFAGQFAFVGMSKARETSVFGGVPICQDRSAMRCGIVVIDLKSSRSVAFLEFESGVDELFDVQVIPRAKRTELRGPFPREDNQPPVWVVPPEQQVNKLVNRSQAGPVSRNRPL
ncbi:MAG: TIGR03032 family protein [Planctomycetota bacterium]